MKTPLLTTVSLTVLVLCSSCASYVTPGGRADFSTFTDESLKEAYEATPQAKFPAHLVAVRVQESGYRNYRQCSYGAGRYSVVTERDIENDSDFSRLVNLDGVAQVGALNRLLLPSSLGNDLAIRNAAARLHGDLLLLYTLDTTFTERDVIAPLGAVTIGLAPNRRYKIHATAAALLLDVRSGYVYGTLEETVDSSGLTMAWGSRDAIDGSRQKVERKAFEKLLDQFEPFWNQVYQRYR